MRASSASTRSSRLGLARRGGTASTPGRDASMRSSTHWRTRSPGRTPASPARCFSALTRRGSSRIDIPPSSGGRSNRGRGWYGRSPPRALLIRSIATGARREGSVPTGTRLVRTVATGARREGRSPPGRCSSGRSPPGRPRGCQSPPRCGGRSGRSCRSRSGRSGRRSGPRRLKLIEPTLDPCRCRTPARVRTSPIHRRRRSFRRRRIHRHRARG